MLSTSHPAATCLVQHANQPHTEFCRCLISFIGIKTSVNGEKLGTYGVIKGSRNFIGATVSEGELALEALGYSFEKLILYVTSLGLGTCWLGGTFSRSEFASVMDFKGNEPLRATSPIGVPSDKKRITESIVRWIEKANKRKDWNEFFLNRIVHNR